MEFVTTSMSTWVLYISVTILAYCAWMLFVFLWLKPLRAKWFLEAQGLKGMPYRLFYGNIPEIFALGQQARRSPMPQISHDIAPRLLPIYFVGARKLGNPFFLWFGTNPRIFVTKPELVREVLSDKLGHYRKPSVRPDTRSLLASGIVGLEGEKWAQHRRLLSPAFFIEKVKAMTPTMATCTVSMLNDWATQIEKEVSGRKEIDVHACFKTLTADVIAHTAFGNSFADGKKVFQLLNEQQTLVAKLLRTVYFPGARFAPTQKNRYRWKLEKQIQELVRRMIYSRMDAIKLDGVESYGNDLLGLMMAADRPNGNQKGFTMKIWEMVEECTTFFLAGHETTSALLTWTFLLLGTSIEWQQKAREEVLKVCGKEAPTPDSLNSLKTVGMVLNEALRLYPPAFILQRNVSKETRLGKELVLQSGTEVVLPVTVIHHDPSYWGPDADIFNPQRFAEGIAKAANHPAAFVPFGAGPRNCIGQNFALLEAKVALALILQRFAFHVAPTYTHSPSILLTLQPQFGMQIVFEMLSPTH